MTAAAERHGLFGAGANAARCDQGVVEAELGTMGNVLQQVDGPLIANVWCAAERVLEAETWHAFFVCRTADLLVGWFAGNHSTIGLLVPDLP